MEMHFTPTEAMQPFTRDMARTMTPNEIDAFWIARQRARRDAGLDHYTVLRDATQPGCPVVARV